MAPKRKQPTSNEAPKPPAKRRSKLAKENDISAEQEDEIREAFGFFATQKEDVESSKEGVVSTNDVRRCLTALNAPPRDDAEFRELMEVADPDEVGWVTFEHFVGIAAILMARRDDDPDAVNEEVAKAYRLFTKGEDRLVTLSDLRRVARDIREDVPENVLKDMLREATGGGLGGVSMDDFEGVMRRAGVLS